MASSELFIPQAPTGHRRRTSPLLRVGVFLTRAGLDARIAGGELHEGGQSASLQLRAAQLARIRTRRGLANGLRNVLDAAEEPPRLTAAIPLNRPGLRVARAAIEDLAEALEAPGDVAPRGVAMTAVLLRSGDSPLYRANDADDLRIAVVEARKALDPWT
jgi:hypothetical protein